MNTFYSKRTHSIVSERILQSENTFYSERAHSVPTCGLQVPVTHTHTLSLSTVYLTKYSVSEAEYTGPTHFCFLLSFSHFFFVRFGVSQEECTRPTHFCLLLFPLFFFSCALVFLRRSVPDQLISHWTVRDVVASQPLLRAFCFCVYMRVHTCAHLYTCKHKRTRSRRISMMRRHRSLACDAHVLAYV